MKIKKRSDQRIVLAPDLGDRIFGAFFAGFAILVLSILIASKVLSMVPAYLIFPIVILPLVFTYIGIRIIIGHRIIFDKSTESVILESPGFMLFRNKVRNIPFVSVNNLEIIYKKITYGKGRSYWGWLISLDTIGGKVEIVHSEDKDSIYSLAEEIGNYIGKVLVESSERKGNWFTRFFNINASQDQSSELKREEEGQEKELSLEERWERGGLLPLKDKRSKEPPSTTNGRNEGINTDI